MDGELRIQSAKVWQAGLGVMRGFNETCFVQHRHSLADECHNTIVC